MAFPGTLLVQLAMMAVMLYLASYLLAGWYGIWAGIGFAGLAFNVARPYLFDDADGASRLHLGLFRSSSSSSRSDSVHCLTRCSGWRH